jgi:uncharacterized LabA/DUF88 family protein
LFSCSDTKSQKKGLNAQEFIKYFVLKLGNPMRHNLFDGSFKRGVFYFPSGDTGIGDYISMPDFNNPGEVKDIQFKYCGRKLRRSAPFEEFVLTKVPEKWRGRFSKSEKGIDTEMCCDALLLAATGKLDRLFLLTNDEDFIPLCKRIKELGANISLIHLHQTKDSLSSKLREECDSYDVVEKNQINGLFTILKNQQK